MYLKCLIVIVSSIICVSSEMAAIEEMYLNFFTQIESVKKSIDILKVRVDVLSERNQNNNCGTNDNKYNSQVLENFDDVKKSLKAINSQWENKSDSNKPQHQELENKIEYLELQQKNLVNEIYELRERYAKLLNDFKTIKKSEESESQILKTMEEVGRYYKKPLFDVRTDKLPEFKENCLQDPLPIDCKAATKCTDKSGYYEIYLSGNKTNPLMVFCDTETTGGNWLYVLKRKDGSQNFTRSWSDYVNGFGNVEGEYWIGLDNLHTLTNSNGRQQLYVYIENFEGESRFALYDNFAVGNGSEFYQLKSLGKYNGTAGDAIQYNVGSKFSTVDKDNDMFPTGSCAKERLAGWWYNYCTFATPTGRYLHGKANEEGLVWNNFGGFKYSHKIMHFMIRKLEV